jgi:hypothetical protein
VRLRLRDTLSSLSFNCVGLAAAGTAAGTGTTARTGAAARPCKGTDGSRFSSWGRR